MSLLTTDELKALWQDTDSLYDALQKAYSMGYQKGQVDKEREFDPELDRVMRILNGVPHETV